VYRIAHAAGRPPAQAVAEVMGVPRSTAGRWIMRARRAGLLPPTSPGKARA
jgi:transposase